MNEIAQIRADAARSQFWTEARTKTVIRLWTDGNTAAAIAAVLGCSRTTVSSKVNRLGLVMHGLLREGSQRQRTEELLPDPSPPADGDVAQLQLVDLTDGTCRWPVGDPLREGFGFCGKEVREGSVYCDHHHSRAYRCQQ